MDATAGESPPDFAARPPFDSWGLECGVRERSSSSNGLTRPWVWNVVLQTELVRGTQKNIVLTHEYVALTRFSPCMG